ncbi:MFS transporter [Parasphingopyxis algicola]|uniref:MFS transporter n=1 Tax=Parasphingopyxis algicola TaxID=2026624 RepID=UPI0015A10140|nr:MFS transporter [Parasphingopyxis algicola]QLC25268.1 MFS transporter [Parasphingopyxis algicola]
MSATSSAEDTASWRETLADGRWPAFALIMLGIWLMAADALVTTTIMPSVGRDLDGYAWFGWATSGYLVGVVAAASCAGWLSDRVGLRPAMIGSGILLAIGCAVSALGPDMPTFVAGRMVQGLGAGWVAGFCYVTINLVFEERYLVRVFAAATSIWGVATFVGPLVGGLFADAGNWRGVFWLFAAQAILFAIATGRLVPARERKPGAGGLPWLQIALIVLGVSALSIAGVVERGPVQLLLVPSGIVLLAAAIVIDRRARERLLPRNAARFGTLIGAAYATYFLLLAGEVGFAIYAPAILQFTNGLSATQAGYVVAIEALAWTAAALAVAGSGAVWRRRWIVIGAALVPASLVLLSLVLASGMLVLVIIGGALLGAGFGLSYSFISRAVMTSLDEDERATGSAGIGAVRDAGAATGAAVAGIAANLTGFAQGLTPESIALAGFWVCAIGVPLALLGLLAASRLARIAAP